MCGVDIIKAGF